MNINPPHIVTVAHAARVYVADHVASPYLICGELTITPFWAIAKGHDANGDILSGVIVPRENVELVQDMTGVECAFCEQIQQEIKEALSNGEEATDSQ